MHLVNPLLIGFRRGATESQSVALFAAAPAGAVWIVLFVGLGRDGIGRGSGRLLAPVPIPPWIRTSLVTSGVSSYLWLCCDLSVEGPIV